MDTSHTPPPLRFNSNGQFRILQLADSQQPAKVSLDTMRLLNALVERAKPDLVVYTGDQIKGYSPSYRGERQSSVFNTLKKITAPVRRRGIPFAVTFGNHDRECGLSNAQQADYYRQLPLCLMPANGPDDGSYLLTIAHSKNSAPALAVYLIDSGGVTPGHTYQSVPQRKTQWLAATQQRLNEQKGDIVPAMVFQHIPVPEFYQLLIPLPRRAKGAIYGIGHFKGFYLLDKARCRPNGRLAEAPNGPVDNSGEFAGLKKAAGVFALFCGHDHRNSFSGKVDGIELGYSPSCGFNCYGPGIDRGGRLFVFDEKDPAAFKTEVLTYRQLVGTKPLQPVRNFIDAITPANVDEAKQLVKPLAVSAGLVAAVAVAIRR